MEALIVGLVVALVSALGFLAYNHPRPFARIASVLNLSGLSLYGLITVAYCAGLYVKSEIYQSIYQNNGLDFKTKVAVGDIVNKAWSDNLPPMGWIFLGYLTWSTYLFILSKLPHILELDEKSSPVAKK